MTALTFEEFKVVAKLLHTAGEKGIQFEEVFGDITGNKDGVIGNPNKYTDRKVKTVKPITGDIYVPSHDREKPSMIGQFTPAVRDERSIEAGC